MEQLIPHNLKKIVGKLLKSQLESSGTLKDLILNSKTVGVIKMVEARRRSYQNNCKQVLF